MIIIQCKQSVSGCDQYNEQLLSNTNKKEGNKKTRQKWNDNEFNDTNIWKVIHLTKKIKTEANEP